MIFVLYSDTGETRHRPIADVLAHAREPEPTMLFEDPKLSVKADTTAIMSLSWPVSNAKPSFAWSLLAGNFDPNPPLEL